MFKCNDTIIFHLTLSDFIKFISKLEQRSFNKYTNLPETMYLRTNISTYHDIYI